MSGTTPFSLRIFVADVDPDGLFRADLRGGAASSASWQQGVDALDHSAVEINDALKRDPNSRLLLERLRATYSRRLALSRRALYV